MRLMGSLAICLAFVTPLHAADSEKSISYLLQSGNTATIDAHLSELQRSFEAGTASEVEIRNAYRPFYKLNDTQIQTLRQWAAQSPKSYPAHLALGVYLKRIALDARGSRYLADTPQSDLDIYERFAVEARRVLVASFRLTNKPYLSVFHEMDLEGSAGNRKELLTLARMADEMVPMNHLARDRYMGFLAPRWGGSYDEMDRYIVSVRQKIVAEDLSLRLETIEDGDKALTAWEAGDLKAALALYGSLEIQVGKISVG